MNNKPVQLTICLLLMLTAAFCGGCSFGQTDAQASKSTPVSTVAPTLPPTDDITEIVRRWKAASEAIKTARFTRRYEQVNADGSRSPLPNDWGVPRSTETIYDMVPQNFSTSGPPYAHSRYRFVAHFPKGDFIQVYDGERSYKYYSWLKQLHTQLREAEIPGLNDYIEELESYLIDGHGSIRERGLSPKFNSEANTNSDYKYLGTQILDGRELIKLNWNSDYIYLDTATYLPARFSDYLLGSRDLPDIETVITDLLVNSPVTENDFRIQPAEDVAHIQCCEYDSTNYSTVQEVARAMDFRIFAPLFSDVEGQSGLPAYASTQSKFNIKSFYTSFYVVDNGGKLSYVTFNIGYGGEMIEKKSLPRKVHRKVHEDDECCLFRAGPPPLSESQIEIGGIKATLSWPIDPPTYVRGRIYLEREGTSIFVVAGLDWTKEELIQFAESLQPVETTP